MTIDERALIAKIRAGDPEGFHLLYERYADRIAGFVFRLSGSHSDTEDIVQEVFVAAYAGRTAFAGRAQLLTWLLGIASRRWRDRCRQKKLLTITFPDEGSSARDITPQLARVGIEDEVVNALTLARALTELNPADREALLLVASQGLTYKEAAEIMNEPVGTIKWRVFQATRKMAGLLHAVEEEFHEMQQANSGADTLPCR